MRATGVMAVLVACLAGYTFYEYKNSDGTASSAKGEKRVFYLLRDDLEQIDISARGVETILKKHGDKWQVTKPVEDLADPSAVEGFIYALLTQKGKEFREGDKPKWSEFGLEPAGSKVTIHGKGKTESLEVSSKNAFDGSFYIRVNDQLWLGDRALAQLLEREPSSFRSRKIYRGPEEVNSVEVKLDYQGVKEAYTLKRDGAESLWTMEPKPPFAVDSTKVAEFVQKLTGLNATEFVQDMPAGKPSLAVRFAADQAFVVSGDVGSDVFVTAEKRAAVYKLPASALDSVRVPAVYFRDGKSFFKVNLELVKEIEVHSDQVNGLFVKKDANWEIKHPVAGRELDQEKLMDLVHAVQGLEAAEFIDGTAVKGVPGTPQISFRGGDGKVLFSLAWGAAYRPKYGFNKSSTLLAARVGGVKEAVGLPKDKLERLIDSAIIKKKAPDEKSAAGDSP